MSNLSVVREESVALNQYCRDINKFPLLTREEEIELGKKIISGDKEALKKLVQHNLKYVIYEANKYRYKTLIPFLDIIQEGNIGMLTAATTWDYRRNVKFITFASKHIKWSILAAIYEKGNLIRKSSALQKEKYRAFKKSNSKPGNKAKNDVMESIEKSDRYSILNQSCISLDKIKDSLEQDGIKVHKKYINALKCDRSSQEFEDVFENDSKDYTKAKVNTVLSEQIPRNSRMVKRLFGIGGRGAQKLRVVSKEFGISIQRVDQVKVHLFKSIRKDYEEKDFYADN